MGWDYALSWLTILPSELVTASITITFWREDINSGVWAAVFLVVLVGIQFFGVRGYGEGMYERERETERHRETVIRSGDIDLILMNSKTPSRICP